MSNTKTTTQINIADSAKLDNYYYSDDCQLVNSSGAIDQNVTNALSGLMQAFKLAYELSDRSKMGTAESDLQWLVNEGIYIIETIITDAINEMAADGKLSNRDNASNLVSIAVNLPAIIREVAKIDFTKNIATITQPEAETLLRSCVSLRLTSDTKIDFLHTMMKYANKTGNTEAAVIGGAIIDYIGWLMDAVKKTYKD